ncbi:MAG TPA: glycosyltransferase family 39 protein [Pseudonocardiaceae bacterium]|jgi:4-amino-4-deoxy-L-arabinose transferase-like glycosyltransferase|nr:glycosyltransferase family 39 protein [Pseudonocardiaceae bacterium]
MTAPAHYADPTSPLADSSTATRTSRWYRHWQPWALLAVCVLAALLYGWNLDGSWGNTFYTAAVKSMTKSFTNFLFGSFDPAGVVTVDKPPAALWADALSVMVFGFHKWSVALPQVLEGVAAVFLLHRTVRRWAGEKVALLAALFLALTPITVAIDRVDNPDALLVLFLVAAAYALTRSVEKGISPRTGTKWLLWCAFFIGCGFLTKMLAAWIVVPGFAIAYLLGSTSTWKRRIFDLLGATGVLLASSFWWPALHDLWPGAKPYMDNSTDGTTFNLIFVYNGFSRVFGGSRGGGGGRGAPNPDVTRELERLAQDFGGGRGGGPFSGGSGITRLFGASVGSQIGWLLPLALLMLLGAAVVGVLRIRAKAPGDPARRAGWWLWGGWLVVMGLVFSFSQGIFHSYYTTALAPPIAALSAAGLAVLWRRYRRPGGMSWLLLPAAVAITVAWAYLLVERTPTWNGWAGPAVLTVGAVAVLALLAARPGGGRTFARAGLALGAVAVILVPTVWSAGTATASGGIGALAQAGPSVGFGNFGGGAAGGEGGQRGGQRGSGGGVGGPGGFGGADGGKGAGGQAGGGFGRSASLTAEQQRIVDYVVRNAPNAEIKLAVEGGSMTTSPYIIDTDQTIIGMGGFAGSDNAPSVGQLTRWVAAGKLRYVLVSSSGRGGGGFAGLMGGGTNYPAARDQWVKQNCTVVNPSAYGGTTAGQSDNGLPGGMAAIADAIGFGAQSLYDCAAN